MTLDIRLTVNGDAYSIAAPPYRSLLDALRNDSA